jgi:hypothetical protein
MLDLILLLVTYLNAGGKIGDTIRAVCIIRISYDRIIETNVSLGGEL